MNACMLWVLSNAIRDQNMYLTSVMSTSTSSDTYSYVLCCILSQDSVIRQDELLLTIGTYHSPLNLIEEEFGVAYTRMAKADSQIPLIRRLYLPLMECRQKCMPILKQSRD